MAGVSILDGECCRGVVEMMAGHLLVVRGVLLRYMIDFGGVVKRASRVVLS